MDLKTILGISLVVVIIAGVVFLSIRNKKKK